MVGLLTHVPIWFSSFFNAYFELSHLQLLICCKGPLICISIATKFLLPRLPAASGKWARTHPSLHRRSKTGPGRRRKSSLGIFLRTWKPVGRGVDLSIFLGRRIVLFPFPSCFLEMFISVMLFNGFVTNHTLFGKRLHPQLHGNKFIIISKWQQVRLASMWCASDIFNRFSTRLRKLWFWTRKSLRVEEVGYRL